MTVSHEVKAQGFGALIEAYRIGRKALPAEVYEEIKTTVANPNASVLDLGCGTGLSTRSLFPLFAEVRGCDHDPEMLAVARADLKEYNAQFDEGSAEKLSYPDARFHAITLFGAFHWFCTANVVQEFCRVLKDDGLVFVVKGDSSPVKGLKEDRKALGIARADGKKKKAEYHPEKILSENGFEVVDVKKISYIAKYTLEEALMRPQSESGWHDVIKAGKEQEMIARIRDKCVALLDADGMISTAGKASVIIARKRR